MTNNTKGGENMKKFGENFCKRFALCSISILCASWILVFASTALTEEITSAKLRQDFVKALKGKTVAFVPCALGAPLPDIWTYNLAKEAKQFGMKLIVRDPAWSPAKMTQAVTALIRQKPDILIVHNLNVQLLASLLKKAEKSGIHVIQINMISNYKTDAYIGADWTGLATDMGAEIIKQCGAGSGKSGKVAIIQGEMTSDVCIEQTKGLMAAFKSHPEIKVVSNQSAAWDANKARDITSIVLRQHPDLCAAVGYWQGMDLGIAQAVQEAGLAGKVHVYSSGELTPAVYEAIKDGRMTAFWNYHADVQGHDLMTAIKTVLLIGQKPGALKLVYYSPMDKMTKENMSQFNPWIPSTVLVKELLNEF